VHPIAGTGFIRLAVEIQEAWRIAAGVAGEGAEKSIGLDGLGLAFRG
jgi:hypothetical protein